MLYKYVHGKGELIKTRLRRAVVPFSLSGRGYIEAGTHCLFF